MKYLYSILIVFAFATFQSCTKDKNMRTATIIDTGDITYEGCGYLLQLDAGELVKPNHLPGAYQHGGIKVKVSYDHTGIVDTCDYGSVLFDLVNIKEIELEQ